jgi:hypothetical protein
MGSRPSPEKLCRDVEKERQLDGGTLDDLNKLVEHNEELHRSETTRDSDSEPKTADLPDAVPKNDISILAHFGGSHLVGAFTRQRQDKRKLLSEARADPLLMSGTMTNSRTVTFERST